MEKSSDELTLQALKEILLPVKETMPYSAKCQEILTGVVQLCLHGKNPKRGDKKVP